MNKLRLLPAILLTAFLSSCFTGVEYTPRVGAREVKRENITVTPEDTFLAGVTDESLGEWRPGKRFRVTNDKIRLIFRRHRFALRLARRKDPHIYRR